METWDLERIRFITQHFHDLQGLRYGVPLGLIALGWGGSALVRAGSFLGAFLLMAGARRYYRAFGEVERQPAEPAAVSIYSPAGPVARLEGVQQVPPIARLLDHWQLVQALGRPAAPQVED